MLRNDRNDQDLTKRESGLVLDVNMEFELERMLRENYRLTIKYDGNTYESIIEEADDGKTFYIWLKDLDLPVEDETKIRFELYNWLLRQDRLCVFKDGRRM